VLNKIEKIEEIFFYLAILFLPTQLGRHFWPNFAFVYGLRVDYLSPTVYLTDIIVLLLFFTFLFRSIFLNKIFPTSWIKGKNWFIVWMLVIGGGVIISKSSISGLYGFLKLFEFIFFGFYVTLKLKKEKIFLNFINLLGIAVILESVLAISQFFHGGSLGGIFYFLGERSFNGQTPGIANASLAGQLILRPYATFPHPNLLAAFLLISLVFIVLNFNKNKKGEWISYLAFLSSSFALLLTMSRIAILLFIFFLFFLILKKIKRKVFIVVLIALILLIAFTPEKFRFLNLSLSDEAISQRQVLITPTLQMVKENPVLGVGLNNYLINLPNYERAGKTFYLQPVHNIYLLVFAQTGIIGIIFFLWFLEKTINFVIKSKNQKQHFLLKVSLMIIVFTLGFFDHYFLTLQQGQMLLALFFGFLWTKNYNLV
jgi:O-antigen ligase